MTETKQQGGQLLLLPQTGRGEDRMPPAQAPKGTRERAGIRGGNTSAKTASPQRFGVVEHRAAMPRAYRALYGRAIEGKSLRAAVNAFCLECVCWRIPEIRGCTDQACSLWAVRPYQGGLQNKEAEVVLEVEQS